MQPKITTQPESKTYTYDETAADLTVVAEPAATATADSLTYQWYSNTTESTTGGTEISGANAASYTPELKAFGTTYYYCVVSNTVGDKTYSATSDVAAVTYEQATITEVTLDKTTTVYNGQLQTVNATVKSGDATLGTSDYNVSAESQLTGTAVGTYNVSVTGKGNYKGTASTSWSITAADITAADKSVTVYNNGKAYPIVPEYTLADSATTGATIEYLLTSGDNLVTLDAANGTLTGKNAGTGTAAVQATIKAANHNDKVVTINVTVSNKQTLPDDVLSFDWKSGEPDLTYTGTATKLEAIVNAATVSDSTTYSGVITYTLKKGNGAAADATLDTTTVTDAGSYTVTAYYEDDTYQGSKELTFTIKPKEIDPATWTENSIWTDSSNFKYTGAAQTVALTVPADATGLVSVTGYTGTASAADAGTYKVTANLALTEAAGTNYTLKQATSTEHEWTIAQADAFTATAITKTVRYNDETEKSIAASEIKAPAGQNLDGIAIKSVTSSGDIFAVDSVKVADGAAKFTLKHYDSYTAGQTGTITVTFSTKNYKDSTVTVTVNVSDKDPVDDQITFPNQTATYNGTAQAVKENAATYSGTPVGEGKFTYKYSTDGTTWNDIVPKDAGTYHVQVTYEDTNSRGIKTATYTINKAPLTIASATVTAKDYDKGTTATVSAVTFNGLQNNESLTAENGYTVTGEFADANAGENKSVTVTVALVDDGTVSKNYTLPTATFTTTGTINKKTVTPTVALSESSFVFNNTEQKPTVTVTYADGDQTVTMDAKEYIVAYTGDCLNAGATGADEPTVTVTANSSNYTFTEQTLHYAITKATATLDAVKKSYKFGTAVEDTVTLPTLTNPGTTPAVEYAVGTPTDDNSILDGAPTVADGVVSYKIKDSGANGNTATIPVTITSQNYNDVTVNVVIILTDKNVPTVSANDITKVYDGEDLSGITGTATFDGAAVPGTWSIVSPAASAVKNASATAYNVTVKFIPEDAATYAEVEDQITVTINKAQPVIQPTFTPITEAGKTLADAHLKAFPDTMAGTLGTIAWDDGDATVVVANQSYGWTFTPTEATNYETATGTLIPFVQNNSGTDPEEPDYPILPPPSINDGGSTGNSGSGNSGSGNQGGSTTNPDQSVTTTTTDRDGNVTTTTTYPDGSKSVVEMKTDGTIISTDTDAQGNTATVTQNPDGSSVKTVENIDGSSSIQNTTSDGQTSAMVNLPSETVDASNASGAPASLPMDAVTATKDSATAPVVMVNTANDEPVKVEIPVTNANNGTVAVLVKADGTEEIIKTTALTGDGVAVKVNSGDTVKIIDNTKTFSDTATHWGSDAVTFVAARELFSGTSETRFSPDDNMTRGMLMTVLARYENVDTNGGSVWYEKGVAWAVAQGLSDGTNPNGQISREQLATIIYRYAQSKGIDTTAGGSLERFPDAGSVSDWAREAMSWAVGNGIISGVGGVTLDPSGNATRAQVATILMRFSEKFPA